MTDTNSLSHTKWNCKYHIVFSPKYRRQEICGKIKEDVGKILRKLCEAKKVEIIAALAAARDCLRLANLFNEPLGSASIMPLKGQCIPPV